MNLVYLICIPIILGCVNAYIVNKTYEGYPAGFLTDCPGSEKPAIISKKNLKYLQIHISGVKAGKKPRNIYTYHNMGAMAKDPTMDWSKPTIMYVGGFMDTTKYPLGPTLEHFYKLRGYNVWLLECMRFMIHEYPVAARFMPIVGKHVAEMIANLTYANVGFNPKKFDMVGFSIGGQTMSFIAKAYKNITGVKIRRITGIDPSGVCFKNRGPDLRIDDEDADFVDTYKTNIDGWGSPAPTGHVNFYFNGGENQPGAVSVTKCDFLCSHFRAFFLHVSAIQNDNKFIGVKCNSVQEARFNQCYENQPLVTNVVGLKTDFSKRGIFYVATSNKPPYYLENKGLVKGNDGWNVYTTNVNKEDVMIIDE